MRRLKRGNTLPEMQIEIANRNQGRQNHNTENHIRKSITTE